MASQVRIEIKTVNLLGSLLGILAANERSIEEKMALCLRMDGIDHTSPEEDYQDKLQWLSSQGKAGEMKEIIDQR